MRQFLKEGIKETKKEKMPMASDGEKKKKTNNTNLSGSRRNTFKEM